MDTFLHRPRGSVCSAIAASVARQGTIIPLVAGIKSNARNYKRHIASKA